MRVAAALCLLWLVGCACSQVEVHRLHLDKPNPTSAVLPVPVTAIDRCWEKYDLQREGAQDFDVPGRGLYTVEPSYRRGGAAAGPHGAVLESLGGMMSDIYVDARGHPLDYLAKFVVRVEPLGHDRVKVAVEPVSYSVAVGTCPAPLFSHAGRVVKYVDVPAPTTDPYRIIRHLAKCVGVDLPPVRLPPPPHIDATDGRRSLIGR